MDSERIDKPLDWPKNHREFILDCIWKRLDEFEQNPSYKTRERLLALVSNDDMNQFSSFGLVRFTDYEVVLINSIYLRATWFQISSIKAFLYDLITEATRLQIMISRSENLFQEEAYRIKQYENGLLDELRLYYYVYQKYSIEKSASFARQLICVVNNIFDACRNQDDVYSIAHALPALLNDISYLRGNKKEKIWEFDRNELFALFELEAKLLKANKQKPSLRPTRGVLMTQISNFILKSRNDYNQDYICKYVSQDVARDSVLNHEIWMRKTEDLNDEREQRVIPELFVDDDWINYSWAKDIDFTPARTYYVSSFSKTVGTTEMQTKYGECVYGYKNDRIAELLGPLMMQTMRKKTDGGKDLPDEITIPSISQVIAFDVIYDKDEAKEELQYLFKVIDLFEMTDDEKHLFLQSILQYWVLSVKDEKWKVERERRYVLFLYEEYNYLETVIADGFLKEKTSLFLLPDFILGNNPVKRIIQKNMESKQTSITAKEYLHCQNCFVQDFDHYYEAINPEGKCPICGSTNTKRISPWANR